MSNPFESAVYDFGGFGFGGSSGGTSTGYYVVRNELTKRAGCVAAIPCTSGSLVAKPGYLVTLHPLTSNRMETATVSGQQKQVYVDVVYTQSSQYISGTSLDIPAGTQYVCLTLRKEDDSNFTQNEIDNLYGTVFEYIPMETLTDGAVYDIEGKITVANNRKYVQIRALKLEYPNYNDDQLLDKAIGIARVSGKSTIILWDGEDIHFAGSVKHSCYGFGGIDFGGSRIYMPDYDTDFSTDYPPVIIEVLPESRKDVSATASDFTKYGTTKSELMNKVFTINSNYSGNADMCLGGRVGFDTVIYYAPTMITMPNGRFYTSYLYLVPASGNVTCYNVHDYPAVTFEISNASVIARDSQKMACLVQCFRSNVHLHNFTLHGSRQDATTYHSRYLFSFEKCADIEINHIFGLNPIHSTSGYVLELASVTNAHVHDCHIGDETKWGVMGCNHLTNGLFERCDLNRWDCHYAQYGYNAIRECTLSLIAYGAAGYGTFVIEDSVLIANAAASVSPLIEMRGDLVGVFDGNMIVKNCRFLQGTKDVAKIIIWGEGGTNTKPSNSKITGSPKRNRIIKNCEFPEGCYAIFRTGMSAQADKAMYENLSYKVQDCVINCIEGIIIPLDTSQTVKEVNIEGCTVSDCYAAKDITCNLKVSNCELVTIKTNGIIPKLTANGNVISGSQSVSNFTDYALAGNIASDMASVNKHS